MNTNLYNYCKIVRYNKIQVKSIQAQHNKINN
jgi:hypothetical protein